jgi:hypothetical protein
MMRQTSVARSSNAFLLLQPNTTASVAPDIHQFIAIFQYRIALNITLYAQVISLPLNIIQICYPKVHLLILFEVEFLVKPFFLPLQPIICVDILRDSPKKISYTLSGFL